MSAHELEKPSGHEQRLPFKEELDALVAELCAEGEVVEVNEDLASEERGQTDGWSDDTIIDESESDPSSWIGRHARDLMYTRKTGGETVLVKHTGGWRSALLADEFVPQRGCRVEIVVAGDCIGNDTSPVSYGSFGCCTREFTNEVLVAGRFETNNTDVWSRWVKNSPTINQGEDVTVVLDYTPRESDGEDGDGEGDGGEFGRLWVGWRPEASVRSDSSELCPILCGRFSVGLANQVCRVGRGEDDQVSGEKVIPRTMCYCRGCCCLSTESDTFPFP